MKRSADFIAGFVRACTLILGANKAKWTAAERKLLNRATRMMFGKKRQTKKL